MLTTGPCFIEIPADIWTAEVPEPIDYEPVITARSAPDPRDVEAAAAALVDAEHPLIYAGQGVHYAQAWAELKELAETLEAPVTTSLEGKSAFPEDHPLSLGSGGRSYPGPVEHALKEADVIFGVGASFTRTNYGIHFPKGPRYVHSTNDARDLNKEKPLDEAELNALGEDGWELSGIAQQSPMTYYYLKRQTEK